MLSVLAPINTCLLASSGLINAAPPPSSSFFEIPIREAPSDQSFFLEAPAPHVPRLFQLEAKRERGLGSPYREPAGTDFYELGLPFHIVATLFMTSLMTQSKCSLFQYVHGDNPVIYEIRTGTRFDTDSTTLGYKEYRQVEEDFFGASFLAQVHPMGQTSEPSLSDLEIIAHRARLNPGRRFHHIVFSFVGERPAYIQLAAVLHPAVEQLDMMFHMSLNIPRERNESLSEQVRRVASNPQVARSAPQEAY